jgi:hypothetical protein
MSRSGLPDAWSSPCRQPALRCRYRELAQSVIGNRLDGFPDERLDQQRLRFLLGKAARPQVEQQAFVESAGGGTVTAGDVVGENLQFGLVVGFRLVGQQ